MLHFPPEKKHFSCKKKKEKLPGKNKIKEISNILS